MNPWKLNPSNVNIFRIFLLVAALLVLPAPIQAQPFSWTTNNGGGVTITGLGPDYPFGINGPLNLPSTITGLPVTSVGPGAFQQFIYNNISSISIPSTVTNIGDNSFAGISTATSISLGDDVISIGNNAFSDCFNSGTPLTVTFPNTLVSIGTNAFLGDRFANVTIPNSVRFIGDGAFGSCTITGIFTIGTGIASIPNNMCNNCPELFSVAIPNGITNIGSGAFEQTGIQGSIIIPDSVTTIGSQAFALCPNLFSVSIGNGITDIGYDWFEGDALHSITIGTEVTNIDNYTFEYALSLAYMYFKGNAPSYNSGSQDMYLYNTIVYYMPNTTGWGTTYSAANYPTVLWDAAISPASANYSYNNNGFRFSVTGNPALTVVIQASTNMTTWYPISTSSPPFQCVDSQATNNIYTLYRISSVN